MDEAPVIVNIGLQQCANTSNALQQQNISTPVPTKFPIKFDPETNLYFILLKIGNNQIWVVISTLEKEIAVISNHCEICHPMFDKYGYYHYLGTQKGNAIQYPTYVRTELKKSEYLNIVGRKVSIIIVLDIYSMRQVMTFIPSYFGLAPHNAAGIKTFIIDFPNQIIEFGKPNIHPRYLLKPSPSIPNLYTGIINGISFGRVFFTNLPMSAVINIGNPRILVPRHVFKIIQRYFATYLHIPLGSRFWSMDFVPLNQVAQTKLARDKYLIVRFQTLGNVVWKCQIPFVDLVIRKGDKFIFAIGINESNDAVIFGNPGLRNYKISFSNLVSVL